jgi:DNA-binding NarL/FixJ family response regulator
MRLAALSRGRSNREIAKALSLGEQTVKSYVSSKFGGATAASLGV